MQRDGIGRSVGLSYIFLGGYYWWGVVEIDKQTIACASVAALIFVISEIIRVFSEKHANLIVGFKVSPYIIVGANTLAIMVLLVFPFVDFGYKESTYDNIGTAVSLFSLGVTIYLIARSSEKASEQRYLERNEKVRQIFEESKRLNDEAKAINAETKIFMSSYNKELNEQINAIINDAANKKD